MGASPELVRGFVSHIFDNAKPHTAMRISPPANASTHHASPMRLLPGRPLPGLDHDHAFRFHHPLTNEEAPSSPSFITACDAHEAPTRARGRGAGALKFGAYERLLASSVRYDLYLMRAQRARVWPISYCRGADVTYGRMWRSGRRLFECRRVVNLKSQLCLRLPFRTIRRLTVRSAVHFCQAIRGALRMTRDDHMKDALVRCAPRSPMNTEYVRVQHQSIFPLQLITCLIDGSVFFLRSGAPHFRLIRTTGSPITKTRVRISCLDF